MPRAGWPQAELPQVSLPQQEQVVDLPLLAPRGIALIFAKLLLAQALEGLTLPAGLLKDSLLLVAQPLGARQFAPQLLTMPLQSGFTLQRKLYGCRSRARPQFLRGPRLGLVDAVRRSFKGVTHARHLLVGCL